MNQIDSCGRWTWTRLDHREEAGGRRTARGTATRAVRHRLRVSAAVFALLCFAVELAFAQDLPKLSVADATANEADATIDFVVTLGASASGEVTVDYATSDGTAVAVDDYEAASGTLTIAAGSVAQTISVSLTDDSLDELSETLDLTLSDPAGATIDDGAATGTITDDDAEPELRTSGGWYSSIYVLEGEDLRISVWLSEPSGRTVTVDYKTTPATVYGGSYDAEAGSGDYTHVAGTLTFAPGERSKAISVATSDDAVYEGTEGFAVRFSNPQGATLYRRPGLIIIGPPSMYVNIRILDNERVPSVTIDDATDVESAGELAFSVTLTGPIEASLTYSTADGTAVAGEDYTAATDATLSFGPGVTSNTIRVAIDDDDAVESVTETFSVHLHLSPTPLGISDLEATGTIRDDDGGARLSIGDASASEGDGPMSFTVTLAGQSSGSVTVDYATEAATASAGRDYTEASGTLTFAAGDTKKTITVALLDDDAHEAGETFSVSLSGAQGAMVEDGTGTGTILDNEEAFVTIHGSRGLENGHLDFVVTLSTSSEATVSMDYVTDTGIRVYPAPAFELADAGSDFVHKEGILNFAPGETSKTIRVSLLADALSEAAEAVVVTISNPVNVGFELRGGSDECPWGACDASACCDCGIILDGAQDPTLALADAEIAEDGGTLSFLATLSAESASDVTVSYATSDGTAVAGDDYEAASGILTFAAGETERDIEVAVLDDKVEEPHESLTLTLSDPVNAVLGDAVAKGTILDNDEASTRILLFLTVDPPRGSEGDGEIRVTVTAAVDKGARADETRIAVSVEGSGDADAVDFDPIPDFDVVIPANAPNGTGTFTVVPEDDLIVEADETLTVSGDADLPVTPATMKLLDDDEASTRILLSADPARVSEGDGPVAVAVTASLDRGLRQEATTVTVSVTGGGDPDAVDFDAVADFRITIEANAPSGTGTFTLTPEDDAEDEADETLALTGESDLPVTPASVVLADDDEMMVSRVLSIADAEAVEGAGEVRFAVTLDGPSAAEVTVDYETADPAGFVDPVAEADIDYENVAGTLTFAPGEVSRTIRVQVLDDDLDEPDETFALVLSDPRGATLGRGSALGTIRDDDEPPALSIAGDTGPEDVGELVFSVTLMARALTEVTVNYATMDDTAIAGDDYVPVEGTLTFAPGETARTIRVAVVDDAVDEADEEVFAVTLSGHSGATLAHALATGVIRDNDEPPALSVADAAGDEDVGALDFAVTLSAPSGIEVSASYATKDGTAAADSDYAAATGTLVFAPGEVSQTIRVAILDDALHEADEETFEMTLARLVNASAADVSATGTIRDNDLAPPSVAGDLPAALLCVGGAPYELDLADYFAGKELRFSAVSSTPLVATAALDGSRLTVAPASEGESSVTVTATNDAGSASGSIGVRVVADPAELEAVESVLASIGRAVLTGVTESIRARFDPGSAFGEQGASTNVQGNRAQAIPDVGVFVGNQLPGPPMRGTGSVGWDGSGLFEPQAPGDDWTETMNRTYRRGMVPFSFSLDSSQSGSTGPAWAVWGRADAHRFESGIDGSSHDGTLTAVHLGADARVGDWLAGVSVARSAADADYRFERSVDACGVGGVGDGMVDAELTSVHPYAGRRIGRGSVWATLGTGGGEVSVERCETGQRNETDLSMRLAALGGRHPFAGGERIEVSVVEEISVLDLTTGDAVGPVGDRSVRVGQARLGLEATGVATPGCNCSLTTFVRGFARGDWGDGAAGAGLELAAGARFRNLPRRLGIDAGIRALAMHSAEDARERSANLTFSILPKADGTGWRASLAWRRGASDARLAALGGDSPWTAPSGRLPGAELQWIARSRLGYGIGLRRGSATPFVELDAGRSGRGGARFGARHEFGDRARGLVVEWGIEPGSLASSGNRILLEALGRF